MTLESLLPSDHQRFRVPDTAPRLPFDQQLTATASMIGESILKAWTDKYALDDNPQVFPGI